MKANTTTLRLAVQAAGGTLEEDNGSCSCRIFQAIAPDGMIWEEGVVCFLIQWPVGDSNGQAEALRDVVARTALGYRPMTEQELYEHDEGES